MRTIRAKGILRTIAFDINTQINNGIDTKIIFKGAVKRLEQLDVKQNYIKIDWS